MTINAYNWLDAVLTCQQQGAYLATFHSQVENRWVYEYFRSKGQTGSSIWIGLNDISKEGNYQWIDGSGGIASYSNWISGEPNNANGAQNCMVLWSGYQGKWGDIECGNQYVAMCKWNGTISNPIEGKNVLIS